jgi:predicted TIM-barrel fold metal-dependent hydrolase
VKSVTAIIDAHHHIWRRADLPWLDGPMQPRIFGPYEAIRRDYPIGEYLADIAGCGVTRSVYVQANWAKDRFEDEVAYVQQVADETGFPQGIVGYADFLANDVRPQCDRLTKYRGMRGLRMQLQWHENPRYRFAAQPDLARNPTLQRNVGRLADYGWTFDLQVFAGQMQGAAELASSCPKVTFILQHAGMREDSAAPVVARWRAGMERHAACPNVVAKLSGLGTLSIRTIPLISRQSCARRSRCSVRHAAYSVRIFRSRNCGRGIPR